jgi:hypothetical protein
MLRAVSNNQPASFVHHSVSCPRSIASLGFASDSDRAAAESSLGAALAQVQQTSYFSFVDSTPSCGLVHNLHSLGPSCQKTQNLLLFLRFPLHVAHNRFLSFFSFHLLISSTPSLFPHVSFLFSSFLNLLSTLVWQCDPDCSSLAAFAFFRVRSCDYMHCSLTCM